MYLIYKIRDEMIQQKDEIVSMGTDDEMAYGFGELGTVL
jgi:hypothetical protein